MREASDDVALRIFPVVRRDDLVLCSQLHQLFSVALREPPYPCPTLHRDPALRLKTGLHDEPRQFLRRTIHILKQNPQVGDVSDQLLLRAILQCHLPCRHCVGGEECGIRRCVAGHVRSDIWLKRMARGCMECAAAMEHNHQVVVAVKVGA